MIRITRSQPPGTPIAARVRSISQRIRERIATLRWDVAGQTISIGVGTGVSTAGSGSSIATLLAESDAKLYDAKMSRNHAPADLGIRI